ncbi:MAG: hypothetical protein KatS3mg104_1517 [Phycisphaerae bacterium]|nr:MAG: hypothetical protein KatS3mg104_1517 [Phycisphaerae bacterium]
MSRCARRIGQGHRPISPEDFEQQFGGQFSDIFDQLFGGRRPVRDVMVDAGDIRNKDPVGSDVEYPVTLSFEQAARGTVLPLRINRGGQIETLEVKIPPRC